MSAPPFELHGLAADAGIRTAYRDMNGRLRVASTEALLAVLHALGIDLPDPARAGEVRRALAVESGVQPVAVAWGGRLAGPVRLPAGTADLQLLLEDGTGVPLATDRHTVRGSTYLRFRDPLPEGLLTLRSAAPGDDERQILIISAPARAAAPGERRTWGAFLPLHAFGTAPDRPMTYRDLAAAARTLHELDAAWLGTLPMLASFLDEPFEPSPYAPASRLFWNDLFIDVGAGNGSGARDGAPLFDYAAAEARHRPRLQAASDAFFEAGGESDPDFVAFLEAHPEARDYARFRAACDRFRSGFPDWPEPARSGTLRDDDVDPADLRRHLHAAWLADRQLAEGAAAARAGDAAALYLDLPLGVSRFGYDVWRWPELFATGVSAGAPPDALFRGGQNWGFRPLAPAALRRSGYDYLVRVLRHHMRHAGALRIDHVMSLVRLFWVPDGFPATEGVYVTYPRDELLALFVLESSRSDTLLVGEDLGTVPEEVRAAMRLRGLLGMFVLQFVLGGSSLPTVPADVVASLDTHDTPTFAGFWHGDDIADQKDLGLLDDARVAAAGAARARLRARVAQAARANPDDPESILRALLRHLAASPAEILLVTLEDLWLERLPQNVPGTSDERPNWRRRARLGLDEAFGRSDITDLLRELGSLRAAATERFANHP